MTRILLVCMANICRSPMACSVGRQMARNAGRLGHFEFDSAGTQAQIGKRMDVRARTALLSRGYEPGKTRSRPVREQDFQRFDLILAMDALNLNELQRQCPPLYHHKLQLLMSFAPALGVTEVPDPYHGDQAGFLRVLDLCEAAMLGLLENL